MSPAGIAAALIGALALAAPRPSGAAPPAGPPAYPPPAYPYPPPQPYAYPPPPPYGYPPPGYGYPPPAYPSYSYAPPGTYDRTNARIDAAVRERRRRRGFLVAGLVTFGVSWGLATALSLSLSTKSDNSNGTGCAAHGTCDRMSEVLWIPVAGPALAYWVDSSDMPRAPITGLWTLAEAVGLTFVGLAIFQSVSQSASDVHDRSTTKVSLVPTIAGEQRGLTLRGTW